MNTPLCNSIALSEYISSFVKRTGVLDSHALLFTAIVRSEFKSQHIAIGARCLPCCYLAHDISLVTFRPPCSFVSFNPTFSTSESAKGCATASISADTVKDKSRKLKRY
ncbi:TPA: hypothetical protein ACH3X2_013602 [Trebouxia sp. C0005]